MKTHKLKIKLQYALPVVLGAKTFELRKDDRGFKAGDLIEFTVVDGELFMPVYQISYVLKGVPEYGLAEGYCILAIKPNLRD